MRIPCDIHGRLFITLFSIIISHHGILKAQEFFSLGTLRLGTGDFHGLGSGDTAYT